MHFYLGVYAVYQAFIHSMGDPCASGTTVLGAAGLAMDTMNTVDWAPLHSAPRRVVEMRIAPHPANIPTHVGVARKRGAQGVKFNMFTLEVVQCMPPPQPGPESMSREMCPHQGGRRGSWKAALRREDV